MQSIRGFLRSRVRIWGLVAPRLRRSSRRAQVRNGRSLGWEKVALCYATILGVPTILYYYLRLSGSELLPLHAVVASFYLLTALMIIVETTAGLCRRFAGRTTLPMSRAEAAAQLLKGVLGWRGARLPDTERPLPRSTLIVVAFLPNEQDIIIETLEHVLNRIRRPRDGLEVILAYNTPIHLPVERELDELRERHPNLRLLQVDGSESKAENLNAALEIVTGEITGVLDADHLPRPDCLERAWRWLESDYDVVQGRSIIRNFGTNLETRCIGVEFECMYGVSHPARSLLVDTGIFGGSNGFWRTEVLREIRFDPGMMTEDIDASMRALLRGYRIVADRSIVSTELAACDFRSFWFQRKRWAQGWLEVSLKYQRAVWRSRHLGLRQKLYWTYLLWFRELYPLVSLQVFPIVFSLLFYQGFMPWFGHWYLWISAVVTLLSGPYQTAVAARNAVTGFRARDALGYALFVLPYVMLKHMVWVVALYDHLLRNTDWVVTRRQISEDLRLKAEKNGFLSDLHRMCNAVRNGGHSRLRRGRAAAG
jgi:cellulose synthase/poly-beta-1,6-N-acetylglucosamine synthase-like glycosyltransferase